MQEDDWPVSRTQIPVISFAGTSNTGKTTLIERLIPALKAKGIRVATVKHHHGAFDADVPGKDTYRHKKAGATATIISGPGKIALVSDVEGDLPLHEIAQRYVKNADILIAEGFKSEKVPKIEVYRKTGETGPVCLADPELLALVTDEEVVGIKPSLPVFRTDDIVGIVEFIFSRFF
jgi:molybdopterin-guanine dinucleotide biosynthesis protein MobB